MQSFKADGFRGKRLRLTGYVKSDSVADWAGLWMRVDSLERTSPAFDNMGDRKIEGTTDWTKYTIVLDVPEDASAIAFGLLMSGKGFGRARHFRITVARQVDQMRGRLVRLAHRKIIDVLRASASYSRTPIASDCTGY